MSRGTPGVLALCALATTACPTSSGGSSALQTSEARAEEGGSDAKEAASIEAALATLPEPEPRDLAAIKEAGELRALLYGGHRQGLPRDGNPALLDEALAETFAQELGVALRPVRVERFDALQSALLEGRGDLIAAQMTVTASRAEALNFSRSRMVVSEVLVGRESAPSLPATLEKLAGLEIHVRESSSYADTLKQLRADGIDLKIVTVPEDMSSFDLLEDVASGKRPFTVVDDNILGSAKAIMPELKAVLTLAEGRQLAWAVRKDQPELAAIMNRFVVERALTTHTRQVYRADLDEIKKRGVLRVLTENSGVSYFLYRGDQYGFDFELAEVLAEALDVRLQMVVVPTRDQLIPWLLEGRGDLIAAALTVTPDRAERVRFSRPYLYVDEVVVRKRGAGGPNSVEELAGRTVHVPASSSFLRRLEEIRKQGVDVKIETVPADVNTEQLVERVVRGDIELTVADSHHLDVELRYGREVEPAFPLKTEAAEDGRKDDEGVEPIAFAVPPTSEKLGAFLDDWVRRNYRGLRYNIAKQRYFESHRRAKLALGARTGKTGQISPYDRIIQKYAARYGLDWRLMAAQAYVESRFDPNAKSWVGALGLFQVMPNTGRSMGFDNLQNVEQGVHAGIKYMARLMRRFDDSIPLRQRIRLALAAYNVGLGHVYDAQRLAAELGLDPNRWFGNVEKAMLLLSERKYARQARHGYARGAEPVAYVSHIQSKYEAYVKVVDL